MKTLVLASASPRRSAILAQIRVPFRTEPSSYEENDANLSPMERPLRFAEGKALDVSRKFPGEPVLGFDTLVFLDALSLGKPKDRADALSMLKRLNGRSHRVVSGVALAVDGKILASDTETTAVTFRNVPESELERYVDSGEPMDKAGAYAIQGLGARLVESIDGCFYNVVGLPVAKTLKLIENLGE